MITVKAGNVKGKNELYTILEITQETQGKWFR